MPFEYLNEYIKELKRDWRIKRVKNSFDKAKKLAELKYSADGKRYYVFKDPHSLSFIVINNRQMNMIYTKFKIKFDPLQALYKTK
jgi:hypothetical protein